MATTISASMVKDLRVKTGAGMMECKKALEAAGGDMEAAIDELRKLGQAIADKKGARATKEGLIFSHVAGGVGALLEMNCETDFVARNEMFTGLGNELVRLIHGGGIADVAALGAQKLPGRDGRTVAEALREAIAKIGENMGISRFVRVDAHAGGESGPGMVHVYIHPPGKQGSLVELHAGKPQTLQTEPFLQLARDLAMHVTAAQPLVVERSQVPAETLTREKAIYLEQTKLEGKPEKMWEKIAEGRLAKFFKDAALLEQVFVRDPDQTIKSLLETVGKELGDTIRVTRFERYALGGGAEEKGEGA